MPSRNPVPFLRRKGFILESSRPRPRLDIRALLVNTVPLTSGNTPSAGVLTQYEGMPPPDRGATRPWPQQVEEE